jgi:DNA-binding GntR family transcriptional regulator
VLRRLEYLRFSALSGRESIEQHKKIVSLCRKRDADAAAAATERNWQTLSQLVDQLNVGWKDDSKDDVKNDLEGTED